MAYAKHVRTFAYLREYESVSYSHNMQWYDLYLERSAQNLCVYFLRRFSALFLVKKFRI